MPRFVAAVGEHGARLDLVLAARAGLSRSGAQRLISQGLVTVEGLPAAKHRVMRTGEAVVYTLPPATETALVSEEIFVPVIYEDAALLVVDKPAGLVVHPAAGHERGTLVHALLERGLAGGNALRPGVVHRLDKDTSGLMVVARSEAAYQALVALMTQHRIRREYAALVCGRFPEDEGTIDAPIGRHIRDRKRMSVHTHEPRRAITHVVVARRFADYTLLDVRLETGRTHQIRVHCAALGYPVAGDVAYGRRPRPQGLPRQFLHARRLSFSHPLDPDRELSFESPLPADLVEFLATLAAEPSAMS
jgi:23S rRNA pseudouridine1911/1915/1917 synthase